MVDISQAQSETGTTFWADTRQAELWMFRNYQDHVVELDEAAALTFVTAATLAGLAIAPLTQQFEKRTPV